MLADMPEIILFCALGEKMKMDPHLPPWPLVRFPHLPPYLIMGGDSSFCWAKLAKGTREALKEEVPTRLGFWKINSILSGGFKD